MDSRIIKLVTGQEKHDSAALLSFIQVETGGRGFDIKTGKIMIQFEPGWFKKLATKEYAEYLRLLDRRNVEKLSLLEQSVINNWNTILENRVSNQPLEWIAFNIAFAINKNAAMECTSIGLGQIMGFHWKRLGFATVGSMWDDAKSGIEAQVCQLIKFIETDKSLQDAIRMKDWDRVASIYNGKGYKALAEKLGREPYDISMAKVYDYWNNYLKNN